MSDTFDHEMDAYESLDWSIFEDDYRPSNTYNDIQCKYCHEGGLHWKQLAGRFFLFKGKKPHRCVKEKMNDKEDINK